MKSILLVDDEYALVENITELLCEEGYRVVSTGNGKDALARLQSEQPDLLITDFMMPVVNGRDLVRAVRAIPAFHELPIIMMSATIKTVALSDAVGTITVSAFLAKPVRWAALLAQVVALIGPGEKPA